MIPEHLEKHRVPETGIFLDVPDADYRALTYPSFSTLKAWCMDGKQPTERVTLIGNVLHAWLLRGKDDLARLYKSVDEDFPLNTKEGKLRHVELRQKHPGKIIVRKSESAKVKAMYNAVVSNPSFVACLNAFGGSEVVAVAGLPECGDIVFKGMIDMPRPRAKPHPLIVDLKTTGYRNENEFRNAVCDMGYFAQAALYCDLYLAAGGKDGVFKWMCVSSQEPHETWWVDCTPQQMAAGRFWYRCVANLYGRFKQQGEHDEDKRTDGQDCPGDTEC